jgi:hypothetical protein
MDKPGLLNLLTIAERHVLEGARHIGKQKQIIAKLERDGHDATTARNTLEVFEEAQELHIADRARLLRELSAK